MINANPAAVLPGLGIVDFNGQLLAFGARGDGTVGMGFDVSQDFLPIAQLDIRKLGPHDYILNIAEGDNDPLFRIHNNGNIGIGINPQSDAKLAVNGGYGDTRIDIINAGHNNAIRFFDGGSANPTHVIAESGGDLLIDPGIANGGGNDKLKVDGSEYITAKLGVGIDAQTNSTVAVKGTGGTTLDLLETSSSTNFNAQLRWIDDDGSSVRHIITEDATGDLLIVPGWDNNASKKLKVDGNEEVTGALAVTGTDVSSFASKVYIGGHYPTGNYSGYTLGVYGDLIARKVVVETGSWSDKVFASDYSLKSISDLEKYIIQNKHLPEIPSECEVTEKGIDVGEMNKLLLQKVEELTLYVIAQQKQINALTKK